MYEGFAAACAVENDFDCFFEWYAFAFWASAVVEVVVFFVFESDVEFFEYAAFLA
jgi:hypothetical protein